MARPQTNLGPALDAEIAARTARGESAKTIKAALGGAVSERTLIRRQATLRGKSPQPTTSKQVASETPTVPDEVPENAPPEALDRWLSILDRAQVQAEKDGNLAALASLAAKAATLLNLKHKHAPLPKPDPNDNPEWQALSKKGEDRLLTLIKGVFAT
jgi:hypothetical protein